MLTVLCSLGKDRYTVDAAEVLAIVPMVPLRAIPHAPPCVAGMFDYRGTVVPVIDLCQLTQQRPCQARLSSRILLLHYGGSGGSKHILGALAEGVSEIRSESQAGIAPVVDAPDAPYLGNLVPDEGGIIQRLRVEALLPQSLRESLFAAGQTSG